MVRFAHYTIIVILSFFFALYARMLADTNDATSQSCVFQLTTSTKKTKAKQNIILKTTEENKYSKVRLILFVLLFA